MQGRFMMEKPEEMTATVKLTATVKEWEELRDQLTNKWPSSDLSRILTEIIGQARKVIYPTEQP